MAHIHFLGAAGTVTGSRHLLEVAGKKILIDCGLFQGSKQNRLRNWDPFPVPPGDIDHLLLTHAHTDHTGYLPRFCRDGFDGEIFCTYATQDLCNILVRDSAHIQEEDARWANKRKYSKHSPALPLFTVDDAEKALKQFVPRHYGEDFFLADDLRIKFRDAGHILGASIIDIRRGRGKERKKIIFSGDIGRAGDLVLREPDQVFNVDYLVLESTYGDRLHPESDPFQELAEVINASVERGGVLVIPAFSVGRTQTMLYMIRELEEEGLIPSLKVFVDSPMAIDATQIFRKRISQLNLKTRIEKLQGKRVFHPRHLHLCKTRQKSKEINEIDSGAIIISASGMVTAGRILHHLRRRLPDPRNTILFVGYQAHGTRGRTILDKRPTVKMHGHHVPIRAAVESISGFSGHADYHEILAWLMGFNRAPQKVFLVHGEPEMTSAMAEKIEEHFGWETVIPSLGDRFEIDL